MPFSCIEPASSIPSVFVIQSTYLQIRMEVAFIKRITEAELAKELRERYIQNPPEGMTSNEVRDMSDDDLLDMDYFLHEFDDCDDDDFGEEGFYIDLF